MTTASMFQCGAHEYRLFSESAPHIVRWLGEFNPAMTGVEANKLMDHIGKLEKRAQLDYIKGWEHARAAAVHAQ